MTRKELQFEITLSEDSTRQFKGDVRNAESLAAEMAAFANSEGGRMLLGVADDGSIAGLSPEGVSRINQLIGNADSKEELRRLFQMSGQFHADELPTKVGIDKLVFLGQAWMAIDAAMATLHEIRFYSRERNSSS